MIQWLYESRAAVDRKHPYRSMSQKFMVMPEQPFERCKYDFHAPAGQSADKEVFWKKLHCIFHRKKYARMPDFYAFSKIVSELWPLWIKIGKIYLRHSLKSNKIIGDIVGYKRFRLEDNHDFTDSFRTD